MWPFLVSLPQMIATTSLDSESVLLIRDYVNELMVYAAFFSLPLLFQSLTLLLQMDGSREGPNISAAV